MSAFTPKKRSLSQSSSPQQREDDSEKKITVTFKTTPSMNLGCVKTTYIVSKQNDHKGPVDSVLFDAVKEKSASLHRNSIRLSDGRTVKNPDWEAGLESFCNQSSPGNALCNLRTFVTGLHEKLSADAVRPHVESFVFDMLVGDAFQKEKITFGTLEAFVAKLDADYPQCGEACALPVEHASYADLAKRVKELEESVAHIEQFLVDATTNRQPLA